MPNDQPSKPASSGPIASPGLAQELRAGTARLHMRAEESGIVAEMLAGRITRNGYAFYLRNLLPAYIALESGLNRHAAEPLLAAFAQPAFARSAAITADLVEVAGADWGARIALLPSGIRYAHRVARAAEGSGVLLIGHAYARVLGDLSGGQILGRMLAEPLGFAPRFHAFPDIADIGAAKAAYRVALDEAGLRLASPGAVVREAQIAFRLNIAVSEAVESALAASNG